MSYRKLYLGLGLAAALTTPLYSSAQPADQAERDEELAQLREEIADKYTIVFKEPGQGQARLIEKADRRRNLERGVVAPFGMHSTGQDIGELERRLNFNGEILAILDTMNAIVVRMPPDEAERFSRRPDVASISKAELHEAEVTQYSPGWALDRLDEQFPVTPDDTFVHNPAFNGAGRTIYILDSGIDIGNPAVAAHFDGRLTIFHDWNPGGSGLDQTGHGTVVASIAAGEVHGIARGATVKMVKVTVGNSANADSTWVQQSFNWLAANAPHGTIVNYSFGSNYCGPTTAATNTAMVNAANAGMMIFTSAGNDGCDLGTSTSSFKNIPEVFTVGGLAIPDNFPATEDRRWVGPYGASNWGANVRAWAPAEWVMGLVDSDNPCNWEPGGCFLSGTSFASPYVAGFAAVACQANGTLCNTTPVTTLYNSLRSLGTPNTVLNNDGSPLPGLESRVLWYRW